MKITTAEGSCFLYVLRYGVLYVFSLLCCVVMPLLFSPSLVCCCCGRISTSQGLLYLEAEHYQSAQLAACDSILTDLQLSKQSCLFLSHSFFCLSPPPLSFLSYLCHRPLFSPHSAPSIFFFPLRYVIFPPSYFKPISLIFPHISPMFVMLPHTH